MQADRYYLFIVDAQPDAGAGTLHGLEIDPVVVWRVKFVTPGSTLNGIKLTYANQVILPYNTTTQVRSASAPLEYTYDIENMPSGGQWGVITYNADTQPQFWLVTFVAQNIGSGHKPAPAPVQHFPVSPMDIHAAAGQLGFNETRR